MASNRPQTWANLAAMGPTGQPPPLAGAPSVAGGRLTAQVANSRVPYQNRAPAPAPLASVRAAPVAVVPIAPVVRAGLPVNVANIAQPAVTLAGTANTLTGRGPVNTYPRKYHPGHIIQSLFVVPNMDPNIAATDPSIAITQNIGAVSAKLRPYIVVVVTDTHLKCVPMLSSGRRGFGSKPRKFAWECTYLRHCTDNGNEWIGYAPRDYLMTNSKYKPYAGSYVMWTRTHDVEFEWPITILGSLTRESGERLKKMHRIAYDMGRNDIQAQRAVAQIALNAIVVNDEFNAMRVEALATTVP